MIGDFADFGSDLTFMADQLGIKVMILTGPNVIKLFTPVIYKCSL
jgi:hypothetical protein